MGKGGRFGKYGEQKRLERLRQKQRGITRSESGKKFPERNPWVIKKTETYLAHRLIFPSAHLNDTPQISSFPYDLRQRPSPLGRSIPSPEWTPAF